jgi:WD40 repeat protein
MDGTLSLWDLESGKKIQDLGVLDGPVHSVALSKSGDIAMAVHEKTLRVVKLPADKLPGLKGTLPTTPIESIAYSPRASSVLAAGSQEVYYLDLRNDLMHNSSSATAPASGVAYMPDGLGYVLARPIDNREGFGELTLRGAPGVYAPRYAERRYRGHAGGTMAFAIVQNGARIVSGGNDNHVRIWNTATEEEIGNFDVGMPVRFLVVSPDCKLAAIASDRPEVTVWNIEEQKSVGKFTSHSLAIRAMVLAKDTFRVATASGDRTARVWDLVTATEVAVFEHPAAVSAIDIAPDGKWIVTGSDDGSLRLWNVESQQSGPMIWAHEGPVDVVTLSPDTRTMLSSGQDQQLRWWNTPGHDSSRRSN